MRKTFIFAILVGFSHLAHSQTAPLQEKDVGCNVSITFTPGEMEVTPEQQEVIRIVASRAIAQSKTLGIALSDTAEGTREVNEARRKSFFETLQLYKQQGLQYTIFYSADASSSPDILIGTCY